MSVSLGSQKGEVLVELREQMPEKGEGLGRQAHPYGLRTRTLISSPTPHTLLASVTSAQIIISS